MCSVATILNYKTFKKALPHLLKNAKFKMYTIKQPLYRNFCSMTSKVTRSQSYVSINVAENTNSLKRSRFHIFVRKVSNQKSSKPKEKRLSRADLVRLFSLAKPEAWKLMGAVCLLFISSAVTMAVPFTLGKVLDIIYTNSDNVEEARSKMNRLCGILIAVFIVGGICNFGRVYIMSTSGYRMTQSLRLRVFSSVLKQEQGWFDTRPTGELINRLSSDTQIVGQALTTNISDGLRSTIMVLAGSGMMVKV
uniref:ABC transmembrane type-1 domain-containing protein n=2 Tax=Photinus pyralis TaxID=7054 RepID=A0A1Y1LBW0_PHOPY